MIPVELCDWALGAARKCLPPVIGCQPCLLPHPVYYGGTILCLVKILSQDSCQELFYRAFGGLMWHQEPGQRLHWCRPPSGLARGPWQGLPEKTFSPTVATVVLWLWWDIPQLSRIVVWEVEGDPTWGKLGWNVQIIACFLSPKNLLRSTRGENGQNLASWEIKYLIRVSIFISLHHPRWAMWGFTWFPHPP